MSATSPRPFVQIYTDGACSPNPGTGGWAAILVSPGHQGQRKELTGAEPNTTNNRMELMAAIAGLEALKRPCRVELFTDSRYLQQAFTAGWLANWSARGWKTAGGGEVRNVDLWRRLHPLAVTHQVQWEWVRGHSGHPENTRADALAVTARQELARRSS